nr:hypothetical protein [Schwartzia sp. (in: firmicutes)]
MNRHLLVLAWRSACAAVIALLGAGCMAFNVGNPEEYTFQVGERIDDGSVVSSTIRSEYVSAEQSTNARTISIGLGTVLEDEVEVLNTPEFITVKKQHKLCFGLFPDYDFFRTKDSILASNSRLYMVPKEYAYAGNGQYENSSAIRATGMLTIGAFFGTIISLLYEPFWGSWDANRHYYDPNGVTFDASVVTHATVSNTQKMSDLAKAPLDIRNQINAWTYLNNSVHTHEP